MTETRRSVGKAKALTVVSFLSRMTRHVFEERRENDAGGLFQHPVREPSESE